MIRWWYGVCEQPTRQIKFKLVFGFFLGKTKDFHHSPIPHPCQLHVIETGQSLPPVGHWLATPVKAMKQESKTESLISIFPLGLTSFR